MELNIMQKFWQKSDYSPFWILVSRGKKNSKEPLEALMRAINYVFWMEPNMTLKILAFCIPSFQSSWHFTFFLELNTPLISVYCCCSMFCCQEAIKPHYQKGKTRIGKREKARKREQKTRIGNS
jgi:hypothetical protein